jgi:ribosomal protein S18 acetylase RimI-like enzyme
VHDLDGDVLAAALARAFFDDPISVWVEPNDDRRLDSLQQQFAVFFHEVFLDRRTIDVIGDIPTAQAVWAPPGTWEFTEDEGDAVGSQLAAILGDEIARVGAGLGEVDARHPTEPHWYLDFLGVEPAEQGRGHGSSLLTQGLRRCDEADQPAYLWTAKQRNVALYERHGFVVSWTHRITDGPLTWGMWRNPHA